MKKHLSVLMLAARGTIYKVLLLILATGAVQAGLFWQAMQGAFPENGEWMDYGGLMQSLFSDSHIALTAGIAFYLLCAILCINGCGFGSKVGYTFQRLAVSEKTVTLWWALYNGLVFVVFWASQALVMLGLCKLYEMQAPAELFGPQTVFLAFYRERYLHSLMPMAEISRWIRNIILCASLGICTSTFSYNLRHGKKGIAIFVLAVVTFGMFCAGMGEVAVDVTSGVLAVIVAGVSVFLVWGGLYDGEE